MKIIVLHGDHTVKSYERLMKFIDVARSRNWDIQKTSDAKLTLPELIISDSLFQKERLVVIEDVKLINKNFSKWIKSKEKIINANIIVYHKGTLSKTVLNLLPDVNKVEEFKIPQKLWNFIDSFFPKNSKLVMLLLNEVTKKEPVEFVFSLLAKQLRDLYWVKKDSKSLKYPSWRIEKLKRQASKYTEEKLKNVISLLADADIRSKTSGDNLKDLLDFIVMSELQ